MKKLAAILTCFNRKAKTISCLESLYKICPDCHVFLTDDGSTDGTSEAIKERFPQVNILKGSGNLFWNRGMHKAWEEASKGDYAFYLWLNDDVVLYDFVINELFECQNLIAKDCIISGLIDDEQHKKILYGGTASNGKLIQASDSPQAISHLNGNVVLVPQTVVEKIGILDPKLHHDIGDVDYGLTAIENGIPVYSTRRAVAYGYENHYCRIRKWGSNIIGRFKKLNHPLGSPIKTNFYFRKKHFGIINATIFCAYLIVLNTLPDFAVQAIWGDKYKNHHP